MFKKLTLDNGIRVVYEKIEYVKSLSIGIWIGTGSRNENKENNGISHFIEHMMFKGTTNRSAKEIAESIDNIGGQLNAFTGKEYTCYYTKTLDSHMDIAIEILADMIFNSKFDKKDIQIEKNVICEEINMYEDSPEELVQDLLSGTVWDGNPLGYPILGTLECISNIDRTMIKNYMQTNYTPQKSVIAVAGNFDENRLIDVLANYFGNWHANTNSIVDFQPVEFKNKKVSVKPKDIEQVHVCMGFRGIEHGNDDIYSLLAVNSVFGGGMSSRLFQKIREEKGLVYSIYSYPSSYKNAGLFNIYAGMNPKHIDKVIELIIKELKELETNGLKKKELAKSKEQLKGNYILGLESTSSRMNSIGKSELLLGYINTPDEILKKIDSITQDSVLKVIKEIFDINNMSMSIIGNIKNDISFDKFLKS